MQQVSKSKIPIWQMKDSVGLWAHDQAIMLVMEKVDLRSMSIKKQLPENYRRYGFVHKMNTPKFDRSSSPPQSKMNCLVYTAFSDQPILQDSG